MTSGGLVRIERRLQRRQRELEGQSSTTRVTSGQWLLPVVSPDGSGIEWRLPNVRDMPVVYAQADLLTRFIALRTDEDIAAFAVQWGPLLPNHAACRVPFPPARRDHEHDPASFEHCRSWGSIIPEGWEPYSVWHRYVQRLNGLVETAAALRHRDVGPSQDIISAFIRARASQAVDDRRTFVEQALSVEVNDLVVLSLVRPRLDWSLRVAFAGDGLFGALTIQLLAWVARSSGPVLCAGCGSVYLAARQPAQGRLNWCAECKQAGMHWRHAQRRRRQGLARPRLAAHASAKE